MAHKRSKTNSIWSRKKKGFEANFYMSVIISLQKKVLCSVLSFDPIIVELSVRRLFVFTVYQVACVM